MISKLMASSYFKVISGLVAGIFFFEQVSWAGDLIDFTLEKQYVEQSRTFAPQYLKGSHEANSNLVVQKNAIEVFIRAQNAKSSVAPEAQVIGDELRIVGPKLSYGVRSDGSVVLVDGSTQNDNGSIVSVTTESGDVIYYRDGSIYYIERPDGTVIQNVVLGQNNELLDADIIYPDGVILFVRSGKMGGVIDTDGTMITYDDLERVSTAVYTDGRTLTYTYIEDALGNVTETIITDGLRTAYYDGLGRLKKMVRPDGTVIEYEEGILKKITDPDTTLYLFDRVQGVAGDGSAQYTVNLAQYAAKSDIAELVYGQDLKLKRATKRDGTVFNMEDGLLSSVIGSDGVLSDYTYDISSDNSLKALSVDRDGIKRIYDRFGNLRRLSNGGVSFNMGAGVISRIEKEDGTIIENAVFDTANNMVSAKIIRPDGVIAIYKEGVLAEMHQPDGSKVYYDPQGNIAKLINAKGTTYIYSTIFENEVSFVIAEAQNIEAINDPAELIYLKYNSENQLIKSIRKDGTALDYTYIEDAAGKVINTVVTDGKVVTTYDANNNILKEEIILTESDPLSTISEYEYGRIRRVLKGGGLIYRYTYEFDAEGKEITVIEDVNTGEVKRYRDGKIESALSANHMLTTYEYDAEGRISRSIVSYNGKIMNRYQYFYLDDKTIIEDIDGIKRTYGKDNKLVFLERDDAAFEYVYFNDENNVEHTIQHLVMMKDADGSKVYYKNEEVVAIARYDGILITDIKKVDGKVLSYSLEKDSVHYLVEIKYVKFPILGNPDNETQIFHLTGYKGNTQFGYNNDNLPEITIDIDGTVTRYVYDRSGLSYAIGVVNGEVTKFNYENGLVVKCLRNRSFGGYLDAIEYIYDGREIAEILHKIWGNEYLYDSRNRLVNILDNDEDRQYSIVYTDNIATMVGDMTLDKRKLSLTNANNISSGRNTDIFLREQSVVWTKSESMLSLPSTGYWIGSILSGSRSVSNGLLTLNTIGKGNVYNYYSKKYLPFSPTKGYTTEFRFKVGDVQAGSPLAAAVSMVDPMNEYRVYLKNDGIEIPGQNGTTIKIYQDDMKSELFVVRMVVKDNLVRILLKKGDLNNPWQEIYKGTSVMRPAAGSVPSITFGDMSNAANSNSSVLWDGFKYYENGGSLPYSAEGIVVSGALPISGSIDSAILSWRSEIPARSEIRIQTRTGPNSSISSLDWESWKDVSMLSSNAGISTAQANSTPNKYIQVRAVLSSQDGIAAPILHDVGDGFFDLNFKINFDPNAPPDDMPYRAYLTFTRPAEPNLPSIDTEFLKSVMRPLEIKSYVSDVESRALPSEAIITTESFHSEIIEDEILGSYRDAEVSVNISKDNRMTYLINNKIVAVYQRYDTGELKLLADYSYDDNGNLVMVRLPYARDSLENEIAVARAKIAKEHADYLRTIAERKGLAYTEIESNVNAAEDQINAERSRLRPYLYQEVTRQRTRGWWIFSWIETYTEVVEVPEVRSALEQLDEQERLLHIEEANAYAQLDGDILAAVDVLTQEADAVLLEVVRQEESFQRQIVIEESTPVILEWYRAMLGRDPDSEETDYWLSRVDYGSNINAADIKKYILSTPEIAAERLEREEFITELKSQISNALYGYLNGSSEFRETFLSGIGLGLSDVVTLDEKEIEAILDYLNKQNIHFGRSAFVSLGTILSNNGITYDLEELALKTVLIDIFTGSLNSLSEGTLLELSMYSLSKAASTYGVTLNNAKLNYDELTEAFNTSGQIIAHLRNNHYVVVTNIASDGTISYIERNRGKDGYTWTVSRQDFESGWTGYAIVQKTSTKGTLPDSVLTKTISAENAQRIKGSCLEWLVGLLIGIIAGISTATTAVVSTITAIVTVISSIIAPIIAGIGQLIINVAGFMVSIGSQLFSAVQFVGASLLPAIGQVGSWLGGIGSFLGNAMGLGGIITSTGFSLTALGTAIGNTVVLGALSFGVSKGLTALGVSPTISNLISSFVTGGVGGFMSGAGFLVGGLQGLAIQGVSEIGNRLGIPPAISSIIGISASSMIGAGLNGVWAPIFDEAGHQIASTLLTGLDAISYSLKTTILPSVFSEMSYYGTSQLLSLTGAPEELSYLSGSLIRSYINPGIDKFGNPIDQWTSVMNGLLSGVANVSLQWVGEALDLDPLTANLTFSAIAGAIEGLFGIPQYDSVTGTYIKPNSIFEGVFNAYKNNVLSALGVGMGNDPWKQSAYLAQILDFADIVKRDGLAAALDTYAAGIFNQAAIGSIVNISGSVRNYFAEKIANHRYTESIKGGFITRNYGVEDFGYIETTVDEFGLEHVSKVSIMGTTRKGDFGADPYSRFGLKTGELATRFGNEYLILQRIENGQQAYVEMRDWDTGKTLLAISPSKTGRYNVYDDYGKYVDAVISASDGSYFNIGKIDDEFKETLHFDNPDQLVIPEENIKASDLEGTEIIITKDADGNVVRSLVGKTTEVILENGGKAYKFLGKIFNISINTATAMKGYAEKVMNNMDGLAMRNDAEVKLHWSDTFSKAMASAQPGDLIAGASDRTGVPGIKLSQLIKLGETSGAGDSLFKTFEFLTNPTSYIVQNIGSMGLAGYDTIIPEHTGMIVVVNGEKKVLEMGPFGQQIVSLSDFAYRYRDIEVVRPNEGGERAANYLISSYFHYNPETDRLEPRPDNKLEYNYLGLFGFSNRDSYSRKSYICSEWYYDALKRSSPGVQTWSLPGIAEDRQISPYDLTSTSSQWGKDILQIEN